MTKKDVLTNLKNYEYDVSNYPMREDEARECMDALRKQIPMDVIFDKDKPQNGYICPSCNQRLAIVDCAYCMSCGQAIEWKKGGIDG